MADLDGPPVPEDLRVLGWRTKQSRGHPGHFYYYNEKTKEVGRHAARTPDQWVGPHPRAHACQDDGSGPCHDDLIAPPTVVRLLRWRRCGALPVWQSFWKLSQAYAAVELQRRKEVATKVKTTSCAKSTLRLTSIFLVVRNPVWLIGAVMCVGMAGQSAQVMGLWAWALRPWNARACATDWH